MGFHNLLHKQLVQFGVWNLTGFGSIYKLPNIEVAPGSALDAGINKKENIK